MTWSAAMVAALRSTVERPGWWLTALAIFLVRGGILVFLLPIVILPTPAGLANALAPSLVGFVFGSPSATFVNLIELLVVVALAWLLGGGLIAAWLDVALIADVAATVPRAPVLSWSARSGTAWRSLLVRLVCLLPLALAIARGVARLVEAIYAELITPGDLTIPIAVRVVLRIPDVIALIVVTWLAGETAGGLAARRLTLAPDRPAIGALGLAWVDLLTRPSALATLVLSTMVGLAAVAVAGLGAGFAWRRVWLALADGRDPIVVAMTLASFVAIWLAGLGVMAIVVAWRSAAWTFEAARREPSVVAVRSVEAAGAA